MNSSSEHLYYNAYILRLWQERAASPAHPAVWRFSLEDTHTRQRHGFGDLARLMEFLQTQMEAGETRREGNEETRKKGNKETRASGQGSFSLHLLPSEKPTGQK
jgi:hypothetical protein